MSLSRQQQVFARKIVLLIQQANAYGYEVTLGDAYRDPRCPYGAANSKHKSRLALDLNLFHDGDYLTETSDHLLLGEWWESIGGVWGGRFDDGNHYQAADNLEDWMDE